MVRPDRQSDGRHCGRAVRDHGSADVPRGAPNGAIGPLPFGAYPFLAITLLGWGWAHLSARPARNAAA
jgi:hypothetical protein